MVLDERVDQSVPIVLGIIDPVEPGSIDVRLKPHHVIWQFNVHGFKGKTNTGVMKTMATTNGDIISWNILWVLL